MMQISTVILAGGLGTRIGGDKGLQILRGKPLIEWVLETIREQSAEILISANSERAEYARFGFPLIADLTPDHAGPLAGLQTALNHARHDWVASVPCDTPFLPHDLLARLFAPSHNSEAIVAMVESKRQPAIALYHKSVLPKLDTYLASGERKVGGWLATLQVQEVAFDDTDAFININTLEELDAHNSRC
ncbi:MAG: molybdenum cofactor guanylyltransferase [Nitrosomonadales bacterium]|nr:molybdenum cofactor guanylyltransferase [Nitrosomonadales bacterium]